MQRKLLSILFITFVLIAGVSAVTAADTPARVAIIPFNINAEEKYSFLKDGIYDMLSSRLAIENKSVVIEREIVDQEIEAISGPFDEKDAAAVGEKLQADYILYGSLTLFGNSISTDARFFDVRRKTTVVTFNQTGDRHGAAIEHVNLLTDQIKNDVFGVKTSTAQPVQPAPQPQPSPRQPEATVTAPGSKTAPVGIIQIETEKPPVATSRSKRFKKRITGIAAGDVDGDGLKDIVFIANRSVFAYRFSEGAFRKIGEFKGASASQFIGVDTADINGNGTSEIFVTSLLETSESLNSFVTEWDGGKFKKISEDPNWYYRVINMPQRGKILLGQQRGPRSIFKPGVYEMTWTNGKFEPGQKIALPPKINVFGFTYGNVLNDGRKTLIAFDGKDRIQIFDENGIKVCTGKESFGGNPAYLLHITPVGEARVKDQAVRGKGRRYLPQRLYVADLEGDGSSEIITVKNKEVAGRYLERLRSYKDGSIESLAWDGTGLFTRWKTHEHSGYISDYTLADIDNDGLDEIIFSVVTKTGSVIGTTPRSVIYTIDLNKLPARGQ